MGATLSVKSLTRVVLCLGGICLLFALAAYDNAAAMLAASTLALAAGLPLSLRRGLRPAALPAIAATVALFAIYMAVY